MAIEDTISRENNEGGSIKDQTDSRREGCRINAGSDNQATQDSQKRYSNRKRTRFGNMA